MIDDLENRLLAFVGRSARNEQPPYPQMRLGARVESLFAADYLTRPRDYTSELFVCHRCECVVFDHEARERGNCGAHETGKYPVVAEAAPPAPRRRTTLAWRS